MNAELKKFIAGALCPSCKKIDKIFLRRLSTSQTIECISCGFKQTQIFDQPEEGQ